MVKYHGISQENKVSMPMNSDAKSGSNMEEYPSILRKVAEN
jgi:hypothetical protein